MVYCAAFYCNANSSQNKVTGSWFKFPTELTLFKKAKVKPMKHTRALLASRKLVSTAIQTREGGSPGLSGC